MLEFCCCDPLAKAAAALDSAVLLGGGGVGFGPPGSSIMALISAESYADSDLGVDLGSVLGSDYGGPISFGGKILADSSDAFTDP